MQSWSFRTSEARSWKQNCSGDEKFKKEVEELLASDEKANSLIETPAVLGNSAIQITSRSAFRFALPRRMI